MSTTSLVAVKHSGMWQARPDDKELAAAAKFAASFESIAMDGIDPESRETLDDSDALDMLAAFCGPFSIERVVHAGAWALAAFCDPDTDVVAAHPRLARVLMHVISQAGSPVPANVDWQQLLDMAYAVIQQEAPTTGDGDKGVTP